MNSAKSAQRKLHLRRWRTGLAPFSKTLLWISVASATAIGCGWFGTAHSVRFNAYQDEREMGRLPPLPTLANGLNDLRAAWGMEGDGNYDTYTQAEARSKEVDALWDRANVAEQNGDLRADRDLLRQYLERTAIARTVWSEPEDRQVRRNSAMDRLDALTALERGSSVQRVRAYLKARRIHEAEQPNVEEMQQALDEVGSEANLRDNVAYLKAAQLYKQGDYAEAAKAFDAVARKYPQSEKRERAVFMSGVASMKTSANFESDDEEEPGDDPADASARRKASLDEAGLAAVSVFKKLIAGNPHGKFVNDARGWLAYLLLHGHDRAGALIEYYRLLADKHDENTRIEAAFSLQLVRGGETEEEMTRVEAALAQEPDAALAYAYHNIYNYAIDPGPSYPPYDGEDIKDYQGNIDYDAEQRRDEERNKTWANELATTGRKEMSRALEFSQRLIRRYPNLATGGAFALRAAEASLELGDNESAVQFARRAIQSHVGGDERAQALWISGVGEHRLRHFEVARRNLETLLKEFPSGHLVEGARRMLAMIAEDSADLDGALEQYLALDYNLDVAYFVDVLLTTDQLADFIQHHLNSPKHNELLYALGVRYLRANSWEQARQTLGKVKTESRSDYDIYYNDPCFQVRGSGYGCSDPKEGVSDPGNVPVITTALVMHDIQTANDLEGLANAANQARGDEAHAEALYQLASYQFGASKLLFYNPVAWNGERYWNLSQLGGAGTFRAPNESQTLWEYMQQHETYARALNIYLDVAQRFPRTRAARDALYSAAVCHERLSNYSPYWRDIYENGLHAGPRMVSYADVKATYPNYQLPRGTYSWEPATRTVSGGPAWSAPPKPAPPKPRPSRLARVRKVFFKQLHDVERLWNETVKRWAMITILATALFIVAGISAWSRRMLRGQIVRLKLNEGDQDTYPWMMLFQVEPVELGPREQATLFLRSFRERVWQLARDRESRPVLAANIFAHSLLIWIFVVLVQALFVG